MPGCHVVCDDLVVYGTTSSGEARDVLSVMCPCSGDLGHTDTQNASPSVKVYDTGARRVCAGVATPNGVLAKPAHGASFGSPIVGPDRQVIDIAGRSVPVPSGCGEEGEPFTQRVWSKIHLHGHKVRSLPDAGDMHMDLHVDPGGGKTTNIHTAMDLVFEQVPSSACWLVLPYAHRVRILNKDGFMLHYRELGGHFNVPGKHAISAGKIVEGALRKLSCDVFANVSMVVFDESDTTSEYCAILKHMVKQYNATGGRLRTIYMSGTGMGLGPTNTVSSYPLHRVQLRVGHKTALTPSLCKSAIDMMRAQTWWRAGDRIVVFSDKPHLHEQIAKELDEDVGRVTSAMVDAGDGTDFTGNRK